MELGLYRSDLMLRRFFKIKKGLEGNIKIKFFEECIFGEWK